MKGVILPIKVVIADDHVECRRSLRRLVESRRGFRVVAEAGSGRQAIERAVKLDPDVVFIDFRMPGMDGVEAGRQIQDSCPDVAVILMSFEPDHLAPGVRGRSRRISLEVGNPPLSLWNDRNRTEAALAFGPKLPGNGPRRHGRAGRVGRGTNGKPPVPQVVRSVGLVSTLQ